MSKGSNPRPLSVSLHQFGAQFDAIFGVKVKMCGTCQKPVGKCGCCPTDDGPGQTTELPYERRKFERD